MTETNKDAFDHWFVRGLGDRAADGYFARRVLADGCEAAIVPICRGWRVVIAGDLDLGPARLFDFKAPETAAAALAALRSATDTPAGFQKAHDDRLCLLNEYPRQPPVIPELGAPDAAGFYLRRTLPDDWEAAIKVTAGRIFRIVVSDDLAKGWLRSFDYSAPASAVAALASMRSCLEAPPGSERTVGADWPTGGPL